MNILLYMNMLSYICNVFIAILNLAISVLILNDICFFIYVMYVMESVLK